MKPVSRFCSTCPAVLTPPPKNVFLMEDTLEQPVMASAPANEMTARSRAFGFAARRRVFGFAARRRVFGHRDAAHLAFPRLQRTAGPGPVRFR